jgi:hypothetical protein
VAASAWRAMRWRDGDRDGRRSIRIARRPGIVTSDWPRPARRPGGHGGHRRNARGASGSLRGRPVGRGTPPPAAGRPGRRAHALKSMFVARAVERRSMLPSVRACDVEGVRSGKRFSAAYPALVFATENRLPGLTPSSCSESVNETAYVRVTLNYVVSERPGKLGVVPGVRGLLAGCRGSASRPGELAGTGTSGSRSGWLRKPAPPAGRALAHDARGCHAKLE